MTVDLSGLWPSIRARRERIVNHASTICGDQQLVPPRDRTGYLRLEQAMARHFFLTLAATRVAEFDDKTVLAPMVDVSSPAVRSTAIGPLLVSEIRSLMVLPDIGPSDFAHRVITERSVEKSTSDDALELMSAAIEYLEQVGMAEIIDRELGIVVLGARQPRGDRLGGYTDGLLPGTLFTDWTESVVFFAEVMLHECSHSYLHECLDVISHNLERRDEPMMYSPWRETERPLTGVLQGIWAFSNVFLGLTRLKASGLLRGTEQEDCERRWAEEGERLVGAERSFARLRELDVPEVVMDLVSKRYEDAMSSVAEL